MSLKFNSFHCLLVVVTSTHTVGAWVSKMGARSSNCMSAVVSHQQRTTGEFLLHAFGSGDEFSGEESWSVVDDWSLLSSTSAQNGILDSDQLFNQDSVLTVVQEIEADGVEKTSAEDQWLSSVVDEIHNSFATLKDESDDVLQLYDTKFDDTDLASNTIDDMSNEIAMLIRCNEKPEDLLISEGRAIAPLTEQEKNDVLQLITFTGDSIQATEFLKNTVAILFQRHALPDKIDDEPSLDRQGVARWMTQSLKNEEGLVSAHDKRVLKTLSEFSSYGSGRLVEDDFQKLYLSTVIGDVSKRSPQMSLKRHLALRQPYIDLVWRDIRNHGILSPIEQERKRLAEEVRPQKAFSQQADTIMDECEILDWDYSDNSAGSNPEDRMTASGSMNSHKLVEMTPNTATPLLVRDGEFVFIDEDSCIGCMQCANVAPSSFLMLESGRARTFMQRHSVDVKQAVASCPVDCMKAVTYKELKEYETARDEGDGRIDHKYLGRGPTPLHVAGMDSDNNRRSSWYHTLKAECVTHQCPQKGCFDCPSYPKPGDNPYFKKNQKAADHARAQHFVDHGDVDAWRKTAEL